jgi:hypothetical protein
MIRHGRIRHGTYGVKRNARGAAQLRRTSFSQNGSLTCDVAHDVANRRPQIAVRYWKGNAMPTASANGLACAVLALCVLLGPMGRVLAFARVARN